MVIVVNQYPIAITKQCSCGLTHNLIPVGATGQLSLDETIVIGWFWSCICKTTLFFKLPIPEGVEYVTQFNCKKL